jgi:hypothetical protein
VTSERQKQANRANAQASTGPKTASGKARSAKNAFRHGLSVPVCWDPALAPKIEVWAQHIAGAGADAIILAAARLVAEAQLDLQRVRACRLRLIERARADPDYIGAQAEKRRLAASMRWLRLKELGYLTGIIRKRSARPASSWRSRQNRKSFVRSGTRTSRTRSL